jgi:hypothetical protein
MALQKAVMLMCDLVLIIGVFSMGGYFFSMTEVSAGSWYTLQYDTDLIATGIQAAYAGNGTVDMEVVLPPDSYIHIYTNDGDSDTIPRHTLVNGRIHTSESSLEWVVLDTLKNVLKKYHSLGFVQTPIAVGVLDIVKDTYMSGTHMEYTQYTAPT